MKATTTHSPQTRSRGRLARTGLTLLALTLSPLSWADGLVEVGVTGGGNSGIRLQNVLPGLHWGPLSMGGTARLNGQGSVAALMGFQASLVHVNQAPLGDVRAITFEAVYIPQPTAAGESGWRIRFNLANAEVLMFCRDDRGNLLPPLASLAQSCTPDGHLAMRGSAITVNWDSITSRLGVRWAELAMMLNLIRNSDTREFLQHQLGLYAGASAESIWYHQTPGTPQESAYHTARGSFGLVGAFLVADSHLELRGAVSYRPDFRNFVNDYQIETRISAILHLLLGHNFIMDLGINGGVDFNSIPAHTLNPMDSDREQLNGFLGITLGIPFLPF
jgi:hypothetical protein